MYEHGSELVKFHIKSCTCLEQTGRSSCHNLYMRNTITKHKIASELVKFRICSETRLARLHIWTQKAIAARKFQSKTLTKLDILLVICSSVQNKTVSKHNFRTEPVYSCIFSLGWLNHSKTIQVEFRAQWYNIMMELRNQRICHSW
jgi:16S rRNA A1518/A1519 N6-dimethyltransferase RsmA/KsgA/DIM1 with predicted DNA glycosylase/AP lyase activity